METFLRLGSATRSPSFLARSALRPGRVHHHPRREFSATAPVASCARIPTACSPSNTTSRTWTPCRKLNPQFQPPDPAEGHRTRCAAHCQVLERSWGSVSGEVEGCGTLARSTEELDAVLALEVTLLEALDESQPLERAVGIGHEGFADLERRLLLALQQADAETLLRDERTHGTAGRSAAHDDDIEGFPKHGVQGRGRSRWLRPIRRRRRPGFAGS